MKIRKQLIMSVNLELYHLINDSGIDLLVY